MSTTLQATSGRCLPQEIVDLIVDQVSRLAPAMESQATLRACSLVSKSFAYQSRLNLWENLHFCIDSSSQTRATKIMQLLKESRRMIPGVRSIHLLYNSPSPQYWIPTVTEVESRREIGLLASARRIFRPQYNVVDILYILDYAYLDHLKIVDCSGTPRLNNQWENHNYSILPGIFNILSKNNLKSVNLTRIRGVSWEVLDAIFFSAGVEDLTLLDVSLYPLPNMRIASVKPICAPANLKRLELRQVNLSNVIGVFEYCFPSTHWASVTSQSIFPNLHTLIISIPEMDAAIVWVFISNVSWTLEVLDLEYNAMSAYAAKDEIPPFSQWGLTNLRRFRYRTLSYDTVATIDQSQKVLLGLLTSPTATPKLEHIEFIFLLSTTSPFMRRKSLRKLKTVPHWSAIDARLSVLEDFPHLKELTLSVEIHHLENSGQSKAHAITPKEMRKAIQVMFPRVRRNPLLKTITNGFVVILDREQFFNHQHRFFGEY